MKNDINIERLFRNYNTNDDDVLDERGKNSNYLKIM
jgi:hypothetical protein